LPQLFTYIKDPLALEWSFILTAFTLPPLIAASFSYLLLTNAPLPANKLGWINKMIAYVVRFRPESAEEGYHIAKKNQFLKGEPNFNLIAMLVIGATCVVQLTFRKPDIEHVDAEAEEFGWDDLRVGREQILGGSYLSGWIGIFALMWFLIPVARHSVLLVALGWSPVHALRIHIWAGHLSFLFVSLHAATMLVVWFLDPIPVYQQFIPPASCWAWDAKNISNPHEERNAKLIPIRQEPRHDGEIHYGCFWQWHNLTGLIAIIIFTALWVSSLHWFRRRNYRLFYLLHVTLGTCMILSSILHYGFIVLYLLPSIAYYLASTSPTLVQALASRYRGGVKILKVVQLPDAAGCFEVHVDTTKESTVALNKMPSQFVKLCVPKISVVWHPFTVFAHPNDPTTLRFLCRPVGPFTKQLAKHLTAPTRPVTILDGFYAGANRCNEALLHDHVTIVAGGVAITPFLSMIPSLINEVSSNGTHSSYTKSISLHWACREKGLLSHIGKNYLTLFQTQARAAGISFDITIYNTGAKPVEDCENAFDKTSEFDLSLKDSSRTRSENASQSLAADSLSDSNDGEREGVSDIQGNEDNDTHNMDSKIAGDKFFKEQLGFPMELGRMMPARFSKLCSNIPLFVAFNIAVWPTYIVLHKTYLLEEEKNFKELSSAAFYTVVVVLMFGVFGFLLESIVLHCRSYWPSENLDSFELVVEGSLNVRANMTGPANSKSNNDELFKIVPGRPTGQQLLEGARKAEAPGIFLCGPEKLIHMVKKETKKDNYWLGRTRYCLYEEPFEF
jgi:predicted ferric reductase